MKRMMAVCLLAGSAWGATKDYPFSTKPLGYIRHVVVSKDAYIPVAVGFGQVTPLVLPPNEMVTDVFGLDKNGPFWQVTRTATESRYLGIKPKAKGIFGTLTVISSHGNSYTFGVQEVTGTNEPYDVKVELDADDALEPDTRGPRTQYSAEEIERMQKQASAAEAEVARAKEDAAKKVAVDEEAFRAKYSQQVRHGYVWKRRDGDKLGLVDIWHDDVHTYVRIRGQEASALYQVSQGKQLFTMAPLDHGVYTIDKVIEAGELARGKVRVRFSMEGGS